MSPAGIDPLFALIHGQTLRLTLLGLGLLALSAGLVVMLYTRWGQYHPLAKSMGLSVLAHLLLAGCSTLLYVAPSLPLLRDEIIHVAITGGPEQRGQGSSLDASGAGGGQGRLQRLKARPWDAFGSPAVRPMVTSLARLDLPELAGPQRKTQRTESDLSGSPALGPLPLDPLPAKTGSLVRDDAPARPSETSIVEPVSAPSAQRREAPRTPLAATKPGSASVEVVSPTEPVRRSQAGAPSELLKRPLAVPRIDEAPVTPAPEKTFPVVASTEVGAERRPAQDIGLPAPGTSGQMAAGSGGPSQAGGAVGPMGPAMAAINHLRPPSIAGGAPARVEPAAGGPGIGPGIGPARLPGRAVGSPDQRLPEMYRLRTAPDRERLAQQHGATVETERAVKAALKWLAGMQSPDGHWDPKSFGAGREARVADHDRYGAGATADTGLAGLATLAFLAAGNTHLEGDHQAATRRALEYLLRSQGANGNLGGEAAVYEFMYCHGMATIALSEAYGMTKDARLREPVRRAIAYTLSAQDTAGGGWRYRTQESGDTSQLGWQLMALKSGELAGIAVPADTWKGVERFLRSVSSGTQGGLASYRPSEEVSRTMTAEALMCRLFLGLSADSAAASEAASYVLGQLPGQRRHDVYYYYYGTLAMYEMGGIHWQRWNDAMRNTLPAMQVQSGPQAGSWDPDPLWGQYGGRIYSTALSTLCLEIYYRYLPLTSTSQTPPGP